LFGSGVIPVLDTKHRTEHYLLLIQELLAPVLIDLKA
jgi:hypothetical protein